jgi:hypothetical protein
MDIHLLHAIHFYPLEVTQIDNTTATLMETDDVGQLVDYLFTLWKSDPVKKDTVSRLRQRAKEDYLRLLYSNFPQYQKLAGKE